MKFLHVWLWYLIFRRGIIIIQQLLYNTLVIILTDSNTRESKSCSKCLHQKQKYSTCYTRTHDTIPTVSKLAISRVNKQWEVTALEQLTSPWWSVCTLYLSHARWSHRRRLGSLLLWACVQWVTSVVRAQLFFYFLLFRPVAPPGA